MQAKEVIVIIVLYLFIIFLGKKLKRSNLEIGIAVIIISIYLFFMNLIKYNNVNLGFSNGIQYGDFYGANFTDSMIYFGESLRLSVQWHNGLFGAWLSGNLSGKGIFFNGCLGYGNYDLFVILLAFLRSIGLNTLSELVTIKLFFSVISIYLLFNICDYYGLKYKKYFVVLLFFLYPSNIAINAILLRDPIIIMLLLNVINSLIYCKKKLSINFIASMILLGWFRLYLALTIVILWLLRKFIFKKYRIGRREIFIFVLILIGMIGVMHMNTSSNSINFIKSTVISNFGSGTKGAIKVTLVSLYRIFIPVIKLNLLVNRSYLIVLYWISNVLYLIVSVIFIMKIIFVNLRRKKEKTMELLKYALFFAFITSVIMMALNGFLESRITLLWLWSWLIFIFYKEKSVDDKCSYTNV